MKTAHSVAGAQVQFRDAVKAGWSLHRPVGVETVLLHAVRCGGPSIKTTEFGIQTVRIPADSKSLEYEAVEIPREESSQLVILGTGERSVAQNLTRWIPSTKKTGDVDKRDRTSRAVFAGFCDSIASSADPYTGGAVQLVGLRRKGQALTFGTVWNGQPYVSGVPDISNDAEVEFFDRHLQRVDRTGVLLPGAQAHASRPAVKR